MQKIREEKDEEPTIYSRACGFVESVDEFIGLGCLDMRKKDRASEDGNNQPIGKEQFMKSWTGSWYWLNHVESFRSQILRL